MAKHRISVIINAYNEEKMLGACLDSLHHQTRKPDEIIVVENGSTDATVKIAKAKGATVYSIPRCTRGQARDYGWRKAKGNWIVYGDADDIFGNEWLEEIEKTINQGCDAVIDRLQVWKPDTFYTRSLDSFYALRASQFKPVLAWAYRKDVLEKVGGFIPSWLEEAELGIRLQKNHIRIGHAPLAYRYHRGKPRAFSDLIARSLFFGKNEYLDIYSHHPEKIPWTKFLAFGIGILLILASKIQTIRTGDLTYLGIIPLLFLASLVGIWIKLLVGQHAYPRMKLTYTLGTALSGVIVFWIGTLGVTYSFLFPKPPQRVEIK